jgi:hypothetical protein
MASGTESIEPLAGGRRRGGVPTVELPAAPAAAESPAESAG